MSEEMRMDAERAAFEAWADSQWPGAKRQQLKRDNYGEYLNCIYRDMWRGWQARAGLPVGVPDGLRIAIQQRDHYAARVGALELGLLRIADDFYPDNDSEMALALGEMREAVRSLVAAAPTVKESLSVAPTVKAEQAPTVKLEWFQSPPGPDDSGDCIAPALPAAGSAGVEAPEVVAWMWRDLNGDMQFNYMHPEGQELMTVAQHERIVATQQSSQPELTVWEGQMPESNGKSNFTAVLMRKGAGLFDGIAGGMTIARSEYPDRVRYEADCVRWLIGELDEQPCIIDYDADKHSGYVAQQSAPERVSVPVELVEKAMLACFEVGHGVTHDALRALLSRNGNGGE